MLSYEEALDIVENFMVDSGLRSFCSNVCGGLCCLNCYETSPSACIVNEGRRITCSTYLCLPLVRSLFGEKDRKRYETANNHITNIFSEMCYGNMYSSIHGPKIRNSIVFDSKYVEIFKDRNLISRCNQKLEKLKQTDEWKNRKKWKKYKFIPAENRKGRKTYLRLKVKKSTKSTSC